MNYRKGGVFLLLATAGGLSLALVFSAPLPALVSISVFGFGTAAVLLSMGDRTIGH